MTFRSYDNMDDAFAEMAANEQRANAEASPAQNAITYGDYWMRPYAEMGEFVLIFGRVHTREEVAAVEEPETMAVLDNAFARGYRFGQAWSVWEPRGELGDTHVSVMCPISQELFEAARAQDWNLTKEQYEGALMDAGLHPTQQRGFLWS